MCSFDPDSDFNKDKEERSYLATIKFFIKYRGLKFKET